MSGAEQNNRQPIRQGLTHAQLEHLADVARRAGINLDESGSMGWLDAVREAHETAHEFVLSDEFGIGGHELAVIDFEPATLERLRQIGRLIATPPRPMVKSALAISGSSAQGRIQPYPSDLDYFERIHFDCPRIEDARAMLASIVRDNALSVAALPGLLLDEVYFGAVDGQPIRWSPHEVLDGLHVFETSGGGVSQWSDAAAQPGFVKVDWLLLDRTLGGPAKLSKVIDATWSDPSGAIVSLDDAIDAEYQQVYLDQKAAELAAFVTRELPQAIRDDYVARLERAIARYRVAVPPDYAKIAKRLYNVCRLTGRYAEAIYLRELFDEAPARAMQAMTRLRLALFHPTAAGVDNVAITAACDDLAPLLIDFPTWPRLEALLEVLRSEFPARDCSAEVNDLESHVRQIVNDAFERQLHAFPATTSLLHEIADRHGSRGGGGPVPGD